MLEHSPQASRTTSATPAAASVSAIVMAARMARTPLAVAEAGSADAPILFANDAFAAQLGCEAASLTGRRLDSLGVFAEAVSTTGGVRSSRVRIQRADGSSAHFGLSTAEVPGPTAAPFCLLCSLMELRADGADDDVSRDAALLAQVALSAGDLMRESADAAAAGTGSASAIATQALARVSSADPTAGR